MSQAITITREDILDQIKLSCKIPEITETIITRKIIANAASKAGIKVETSELQQAADAMRLINQLLTPEATWEWLEKHGLSLDDFEEIVYTNLIRNKIAQHLFIDKVEPYFFEHQLDYAGAIIYEVILDDEDLAIELFYAISEGEINFPEIAHQYIQDTELRRQGGYRGLVKRQEMKPEISAAVFAAKPPQVIKPIVTAKGVHLILVEEIIQPQLDEKLRYQILGELFDGWLKKQVEQVEVVKHLE
ncbi:MAG: peptidylprolyl isomerase [Nostocaceae cyanobacterium]|nr:peptidylprolyl isomerase [Nostocaceae cyanobacterium]